MRAGLPAAQAALHRRHSAQRTDELRVSLADKVYNARAILHDLNTVGDEVWERFNAPQGDVLWYYRELANAFLAAYPGPLADGLERIVAELEARAGVPPEVPN